MVQTPFYEHRTELFFGFSDDRLDYPPHLQLGPELVYVERGALKVQINLKEHLIRGGMNRNDALGRKRGVLKEAAF